MEKKRKIDFKCLVMFFLSQFILVQSYGQERNGIKFIFQNKKDIYQNEVFVDSLTININNNNLFILFKDHAFGVARKTIYVYFQDKTIKRKDWRLLCVRDTNTSKVDVELDQIEKEIIFKSKSKKILFKLPFDTLNLDFDK
jgi:hypothetical protein